MASEPEQHPVSTELEQAGRGEVAERNPDERPGPDWGWHGRFPRARQVAGWGTFIFLMFMIKVNYDGIEFEDIILILLGAWLFVALLHDAASQLRSSRR